MRGMTKRRRRKRNRFGSGNSMLSHRIRLNLFNALGNLTSALSADRDICTPFLPQARRRIVLNVFFVLTRIVKERYLTKTKTGFRTNIDIKCRPILTTWKSAYLSSSFQCTATSKPKFDRLIAILLSSQHHSRNGRMIS